MDKKQKIAHMSIDQLKSIKASLERPFTINSTRRPKTKPEYTLSYKVDHTGSKYYQHICERLSALTAG